MKAEHLQNLKTLHRELSKILTPTDFNQGRYDKCLIGQAAELGILNLYKNQMGTPRIQGSPDDCVEDVMERLFGRTATRNCLTNENGRGISYDATWNEALVKLARFIEKHERYQKPAIAEPVKVVAIAEPSKIEKFQQLINLAAEVEKLAKAAGITNLDLSVKSEKQISITLSI